MNTFNTLIVIGYVAALVWLAIIMRRSSNLYTLEDANRDLKKWVEENKP